MASVVVAHRSIHRGLEERRVLDSLRNPDSMMTFVGEENSHVQSADEAARDYTWQTEDRLALAKRTAYDRLEVDIARMNRNLSEAAGKTS